jgi:uncharacterized protein (DUF433 family)
MNPEPTTYAEQAPEGGWRVAETRVSFDSVIHAYWDGQSPEAIAADFPSLSLEQVHGAIAFYLRHRPDIDQYLQAQDSRWRQFQHESNARHGALIARIRAKDSSTAQRG